MKKSFKPGMTPSISKKLQDLLNDVGDDDVVEILDDLDRHIHDSGLKIQLFTFERQLDLAVFILSDRRIITKTLSEFFELENVIDYHLHQYRISENGIHWPDLDIDVSLRGLLQEEKVLTK